MSQENHSEDQTILAVLEEESPAVEGPRVPDADEDAETLARLYHEVLGLIPYELEPSAPRPEVKRRLMAQIEGEETQEVHGAAGARARTAPEARPVPASVSAAPPAPVLAPLPVSEAEEARPPRVSGPPPSRPASRWPLALAATLAVAALGLSAWLAMGWMRQRETVADLEQQLRAASRKVEESDRALQDANSKLQDLRGSFNLVTQHAIEVSTLMPFGDAPLQPNARGMLFVAPDHQHWHLSAQNLLPPDPGQEYQLWFVVDGVAVSGGTFSAVRGERAQLSSAQMPAGTTGAVITLEPQGGVPSPTGPEVLRVAKTYQVL